MSIFGAPRPSGAPIFGSGTSGFPSATGSIFGTSTGIGTGTGTSFGTSQPATGFPTMGGAPATSTFPPIGGAPGGSLFGQQPSQQSSQFPGGSQMTFGASQQPGLFPSTGTQPGMGIGGYPTATPVLNTGEYSLTSGALGTVKQSEHDSQLIQLLNHYTLILSEQNPDYPFKYVMYNRIRDDLKHLLTQFQQYPPSQLQVNTKGLEIFVSKKDWDDAMARNPMPELLYPCQITSWEELKQRVDTYKNSESALFKRLEDAQGKLHKLKEAYTAKIGEAIEQRKATNKILENKMIQLYGALEKIASKSNRATRNVESELNLTNKLQDISKKIEAPEFKSTLSEIKMKTDELTVSREEPKNHEGALKELSKEKAGAIMRILNMQRKAIEGMTQMHIQNLHDIDVISRGLKELSNYPNK